MSKVVVLGCVNGQTFVGEEDGNKIKNPAMLVPQQDGQLALSNFVRDLTNGSVDFNKEQVLFTAEASKELAESFVRVNSNIVTPSEQVSVDDLVQ